MKQKIDTKIKVWRPNLLQKLMYKLRIKKDPRYNGEKLNPMIMDEIGQYQQIEPDERFSFTTDKITGV